MRRKDEPDSPKLLEKRTHGEPKGEVSSRGRNLEHAKTG